MDVVFAYADRMIVLARGKLIAEGDAGTIRNDPRVQEVYFGTGKTFRPHAPLHDTANGEARQAGQGAQQ
jgi:branched-chain amino acid transport system ATP-binding protein